MGSAGAYFVIKCNQHHLHAHQDTKIAEELHGFWEVESVGIVNKKTQSPAEIEALQNFEHTVTYKSGHYQVELFS